MSTVFLHKRRIGNIFYSPFNTNGGVPSLQNRSMVAFCPWCGEEWLRVKHEETIPGSTIWRVVEIPCEQHNTNSSPWGELMFTLLHIIPDIHQADSSVVKLCFTWWMNISMNEEERD